MRTRIAILIALCFLMPAAAHATRLKDIATVQGVRGNQLVGYGLVVGLAGTGDSQQVAFTIQSVTSMLQKLGVNVPAASIQLKNVAAVMVTADLPAFVKEGSTIDVTVSSLGDAASLAGGTLIQTPLVAANGKVYAVAQGCVSVGGFTVGGHSGGSVTQNQTTAGRIPGGGIVEQDVSTTITTPNSLEITLNHPDFTTSARIAEAINQAQPAGVTGSRAVDAATVQVSFQTGEDPVTLVADLETIEVTPDIAAKIVINERTGTVVLGGDVTVSECAIAQGTLTIRVNDTTQVSQPTGFSKGATTVVVPKNDINVTQGGGEHLIMVDDSPTIDRVVKALNALGVTPRDLISILQAMKDAGALHADVEVE